MMNMKVLFFSALLFFAATSCEQLKKMRVVGSKDLVIITKAYKDFSKIRVRKLFKTSVKYGKTFSVKIKTNKNVVSLLEITNQSGELSLSLKNRLYSKLHLEAMIVLPKLESLACSGASKATVTGFSGSDATRFDASGASKITIEGSSKKATVGASGASSVRGKWSSDEFALEASGASKIVLEGTGKKLAGTASGASQLRLEKLSVETAKIEASGASKAKLVVQKNLDASASGASKIQYKHNKTLSAPKIKASGFSKVVSF